MQTSALIVEIIRIYLIAGLCIAAIFLVFGIDRVDPSAQRSFAFRPLLIPGITLIWPLVLWRWLALEKERRNAS